MKKFIPVSKPYLTKKEKQYITDCLNSGWISRIGRYVVDFEKKFANFCGVKYAISCSSGTSALHLALLALGVKPGDEVIAPALTYVAAANAVVYCQANPVFVDIDEKTWNINPKSIEEKITKKTKGIIAVHLYGQVADLEQILRIAKKHKIFVLEDAAEAHGAEYKNRKVGSLGDAAIFSFYGNKIITTGEGGMVTTNNKRLADKITQLKGQGMDPKKYFWFPVVGYNYRLTNMQAAVGLAQLENINWFIKKRREIFKWYNKKLKNMTEFVLPAKKEYTKNACWLFSLIVNKKGFNRDKARQILLKKGIETRPFFYPIPALPPYKKLVRKQSFPVAKKIASRGINLPTWIGMKEKDVDFICKTFIKILKNGR